MTSGSLTDLDPPIARERRWPFYVAWTMGGVVVGAVMLSHLPASLIPAPAPVAAPAATPAPIRTFAPAPLRLVNPLPQPAPVRVAPVPAAPERP
jgi:hypothetical protein